MEAAIPMLHVTTGEPMCLVRGRARGKGTGKGKGKGKG